MVFKIWAWVVKATSIREKEPVTNNIIAPTKNLKTGLSPLAQIYNDTNAYKSQKCFSVRLHLIKKLPPLKCSICLSGIVAWCTIWPSCLLLFFTGSKHTPRIIWWAIVWMLYCQEFQSIRHKKQYWCVDSPISGTWIILALCMSFSKWSPRNWINGSNRKAAF
jgi:hypothetical protein